MLLNSPLDTGLLLGLAITQISLLIGAMVQLAGIKARVEDHHRRLRDLEEKTR